MKDQALLLLTGLATAFGAWAFWHFLGSDAWAALSLIALVVVTVDNIRLRRKLRNKPDNVS